MEFVLLLWFGLSIGVGGIASSKGRSGFGWFLLAVVISPLIAAIILIAAGNRPGYVGPGRRPCPYCAEPILYAAKICPHCRLELPVEPPPKPDRIGAVLAVVLAAIIGFATLSNFIEKKKPSAKTVTPAAAPSATVKVDRADIVAPSGEGEVKTAFKPIEVEGPKTAWQVWSEASKIDDTTNVHLSVPSVDTVPGRYGDQIRLQLNILCREGKTDLYVHFGGLYMAGIDGHNDVTYRIDQAPAQKKRFGESNNHESLGLWAGYYQPIPFIKSLFGKQALLIRATPYNENTITGEFDIAGLEEAIAPLRKACKW